MQALAIQLQHKHINMTNFMEDNCNCFRNVTEAVTDSMKLRDDYKESVPLPIKTCYFAEEFSKSRGICLCNSAYSVNIHDQKL